MPAHRNLAVRCPEELVQAIEALLEERRAERPFEIPKQSDLIRELLIRGLESLAPARPRK